MGKQLQFKILHHHRKESKMDLIKTIDKIIEYWYNEIHTVETVTIEKDDEASHG